MTAERDTDQPVKMPRPIPEVAPAVDEELEDIDPEQTLARDDWESTVIRRIAPRVKAVRGEMDNAEHDAPFGWESEGLRRLSQEVQRTSKFDR